MPLYLCRWPNGDVSIVNAKNKTQAIIRLDEFDNAECAEISRLHEFLIDFRLNDEGRLEMTQLGEATEDVIMERAFPDLEEALSSDEFAALDPQSEQYRKKLREAVEGERKRLWDKQKLKKVRKPQTELGKRLQKSMGAATVVVDRWVDEMAEEILEETDGEGPKN